MGIKAIVTHVHTSIWNKLRYIRYETEAGDRRWIPGAENRGDTIDIGVPRPAPAPDVDTIVTESCARCGAPLVDTRRTCACDLDGGRW